MIFDGVVIGYNQYEKDGKQFTYVYVLNGKFNEKTGMWSKCKLYNIRQQGFVDYKPNEHVKIESREYTFEDGNVSTYFSIV